MIVVRLQEGEIEAAALISSVSSESDGALSLFLGQVRNSNRGRDVLCLEYQAYEDMALPEMTRIVAEATSRFGLSAVALIHRTGRVQVGETSVGVAVASAHRAEAMEGCRFIIDSLKKSVPLWKKEFYEGGSFWIGT
jgi:molybdopterin synthase catalytic subunit